MISIAIIPCRMASSRFPGKPLMNIEGMPMIEHVWRRSRLCSQLTQVYIATCDEEIKKHMRSVGAEVIMTRATHKRSTDRIAEASEIVEKKMGIQFDIVINIGGDEPLIHPEMIQQALEPVSRDTSVLVSNLIYPIFSETEFLDQNVVKVVKDQDNNILYFSRLPIPLNFSQAKEVKRYKQLSIIPFQKEFLYKYRSLPPTPHEITESIDMMRILEHGYNIKAVETTHETFSVDTSSDYQLVKNRMKDDLLYRKQYLP